MFNLALNYCGSGSTSALLTLYHSRLPDWGFPPPHICPPFCTQFQQKRERGILHLKIKSLILSKIGWNLVGCYNIIMYNFNKIWINNNSWKYRTQKPFLNLHNGSKIFVGAVHGIISLPQLAQIYCTNVQAATKSLYYIVKLVIIIRIITIFTILVTHVKTNIKFSSQEQHKCHKKLLGIVWPR